MGRIWNICGGFSLVLFLKNRLCKLLSRMVWRQLFLLWASSCTKWPLKVLRSLMFYHFMKSKWLLAQNWETLLTQVAIDTYIVISMLRLNRLCHLMQAQRYRCMLAYKAETPTICREMQLLPKIIKRPLCISIKKRHLRFWKYLDIMNLLPHNPRKIDVRNFGNPLGVANF